MSKTATKKKPNQAKPKLDQSQLPVGLECLLTTQAVAVCISSSPAHVRKIVRNKEFPAPDKVFGGTQPRWCVSTVNEWMRNQEAKNIRGFLTSDLDEEGG